MDVTYDELRRLQNREKESSTLVELPEEFYASAWSLVVEMKEGLEKDFSLVKAKEYENTVKILRDIYLKREGKILMRAIRVARTGEEVRGLTKDERRLLGSLVNLLKESKTRFEGSIARGEENGGEEQKSSLDIVLMTDLPRFIGLGGEEMGPFEKGEKVALPVEEAERLMRRKAAMQA